MREPDVVGGEVTSVHLESRIVVGRRLPIGTRRSRLEVPTTPEAVALGHLATHVDDLAIPGKLPEDSANSQGARASQLEFLQRPPVPLGFLLEGPALRRSCSGSQSSKVETTGLSSPKADVHRHAGNGSLGRVFDHVGIAVSDLAASERFYRTVLSVLGVEPSHADAELVEWDDWDIGPTDREHPVTRGLHVGFRARDRAQVDAFWQAGVDAGYRDDGAPGPRTQYGPTYYGGFLLDPDGNSVEAVHGDREDAVPDGRVDHLWIRVRDPQASRRFYTTIAPHAGLRLAHDEPGRVQLSGPDYSFSLVRDERPLTEHVHLAFPAREDATVRAFHAAALAAGYEDHGAPGERAVYHPGYYGAFVLDPDGHNVEVVNHNRG